MTTLPPDEDIPPDADAPPPAPPAAAAGGTSPPDRDRGGYDAAAKSSPKALVVESGAAPVAPVSVLEVLLPP